jgi:hypothetical protein
MFDDRLVRRLGNSLSGAVITPGDPRYEGARRVWNAMVDRRPAVIARCAGEFDIVAAM